MNYKSQQHRATFEKAVREKEKNNISLLSAMYLLIADNRFWKIMQEHIEQNTIDFDTVKLNVITENSYTLYCAAKDMYFDTDFLSISYLADTALISSKFFEVICTAMKIRRVWLDNDVKLCVGKIY